MTTSARVAVVLGVIGVLLAVEVEPDDVVGVARVELILLLGVDHIVRRRDERLDLGAKARFVVTNPSKCLDFSHG